jgi:N-acetylglucosaminyl-diphospho-decaprenol L-rhamnosyltransferase
MSALTGSAPDSSPDLSVIIVNWNTAEFLRLCLGSILCAADPPSAAASAGQRPVAGSSAYPLSSAGQSAAELPRRSDEPLRLEVWVVDNASHDASAAMVRENYPQVHLIPNTQNRGFAAANNQGLAAAHGRYAILLNPDTEVSPQTLARMVRFLDEHPRVAIAGPRLVLHRGQVQGGAAGYEPSLRTVFNYSFFLYKLAPRLLRGLWLAKRQYRDERPIRVDWVSGAALMVRTAAVNQVGLLNEAYFMYAEDVEWCRRMREAGWEVYCLPDAQVLHHIGRSARQRGPAFFATNVHSLDRYYHSHYNPGTVRLLHLFGTGGFLLRTVAYGLLHMTRRKAVFAELRDQWWACTRASLEHLTGRTSMGACTCVSDPPVPLACAPQVQAGTGTGEARSLEECPGQVLPSNPRGTLP